MGARGATVPGSTVPPYGHMSTELLWTFQEGLHESEMWCIRPGLGARTGVIVGTHVNARNLEIGLGIPKVGEHSFRKTKLTGGHLKWGMKGRIFGDLRNR